MTLELGEDDGVVRREREGLGGHDLAEPNGGHGGGRQGRGALVDLGGC